MNYSCGCCTSSQSIRFFCVKGTVAWISSWHSTDAGRLSKKFSRLAVDSELWKALFYRAYVRPRASRIPRIKHAGSASHSQLHYSSKISRWLDDGHLVKNGVGTNWKNQYRLRHNWYVVPQRDSLTLSVYIRLIVLAECLQQGICRVVPLCSINPLT
jgi:hypothetical protein